MQRIEFLSKIALFKGLSDKQLEQLASLVREREYDETQFIVRDKDILDSLCLLRQGKVKLTKYANNGKEQIVHIYNPGELMGLCTLFTDNHFPANAVALEKSRVYFISKAKLERIAYTDQSLLLNLVFAISARLAESMTMVESLSLQKIHQRVASFLLFSLSLSESQCEIQLPFKQQELARMLGATPESISRTLKSLKEKGIITIKGQVVAILDHDRLQDQVDSD